MLMIFFFAARDGFNTHFIKLCVLNTISNHEVLDFLSLYGKTNNQQGKFLKKNPCFPKQFILSCRYQSTTFA